MPDAYVDTNWVISENDYFIIGETIIDNFDIVKYIEMLGVSPSAISQSWR